MAHNLTETATHTANVSVPDGGDARTAASVEPAFQALANRSALAKQRLDALEAAGVYGRYAVSGSPGSGSKFALAQTAANGLTLASNEVTITQAGVYAISAVCGMLSSNASNPELMLAEIFVDASPVATLGAVRFSAVTGQSAYLSGSVMAALSVGTKVSLRALSSNMTPFASPATDSVLSIARVA